VKPSIDGGYGPSGVWIGFVARRLRLGACGWWGEGGGRRHRDGGGILMGGRRRVGFWADRNERKGLRCRDRRERRRGEAESER
jgi:hypothetical protein